MVPNPTCQRLHAERDCTARTYECLLPLEYLLSDGDDNQPTIGADGGDNQPTFSNLSTGGDSQPTIAPDGGDIQPTIDSISGGGDNQPTIDHLSGGEAGVEEATAATQAADAPHAHLG